MGCSLVTIFEVLHHIVLIFLRTSVKSVHRIHKTIRCAPRTDEPPSGITMAAFMQLGSNINVFAPNPGMYFNFFYCFDVDGKSTLPAVLAVRMEFSIHYMKIRG